ncbi:MAG: cytidine deaminase [Nitrospirota bacterium]|nr:cytidine deaminase [Nitrospirota bacterium]
MAPPNPPLPSPTKFSIQLQAPHLLDKARKALVRAIAPSSNFRVGAAILGRDAKVFTGCNIESPVYLGVCAERVALFKALSEGAREFVALAIACEGPIPLLPCGTCRQLLWEFAPKLRIVVEEQGTVKGYYLQDLLPLPFERHGRGPFRKT